MTQTVKIYTDGGMLLAHGTATNGSATIASVTVDGGGPNSVVGHNRNVVVTSTSGSNATGKSYLNRVLTDNTTSLVMYEKHPFSD